MNIKILGSSSKGNCYIIDNSLILDAGIGIKHIKEALNFDLKNIVGCLITHEHGDHSKSINSLIHVGVDIYSSKGTFEKLGLKHRKTHIVKPLEAFEIKGYIILPFETEHDCEEPMGFLIKKISTGEKILFATDTYYLKYRFKGINHMLIECNYSEEILNENEIQKKIHPKVSRRIRKSHMSIKTLKEFLDKTDKKDLKNIILLHLSSSNSDAELFKKEIFELTKINTMIAVKGEFEI